MEDGNGKKRNIDERLDALTMNVGMMSHANEIHDRRIENLTASIERLGEARNRHAVDIGALARIAQARDRRRENPEGARGQP